MQGRVADRAVLTEADLAQEVEAQRVGAVGLDRRVRIHAVAARLRHPVAVVAEQEAVDVQLARQLVARGHQQRGPDDRVEAQDVLAEHLPARRPQLGREVDARACVRQRGCVVEQRVDPDVDRLRRVPGDGHAPGHALTRDRQILEARLDEGARLVHAATRQHEVGPGVVVIEQRLLEGRQAEEQVLLLRPLGNRPVLRAELPVNELVLAVELLAGRAVEARVRALEQVPAIAQALDELLHERLGSGSVVRMKKP